MPRYASLVHPGDQYSYDIVSQAARALRQPNGPLAVIGGAMWVIATGTSRSGTLMNRYINDVIASRAIRIGKSSTTPDR